MRSLDFKLLNLKKAYTRLSEACERYDGTDDFIRDSVIRRFEFTYELCHKALREFMKYMGMETDSSFPRHIFKAAYANGIIGDERLWIAMIEDRNRTSHIYSEELTDAVAKRIKDEYVHAVRELIGSIERNL